MASKTESIIVSLRPTVDAVGCEYIGKGRTFVEALYHLEQAVNEGIALHDHFDLWCELTTAYPGLLLSQMEMYKRLTETEARLQVDNPFDEDASFVLEFMLNGGECI